MNEANKVKPGMDVICSCGQRIGKVDGLIGDMIKLEQSDATTGGENRFVPVEWVERVDRSVYLNRNSEEVMSEWTEESLAL